MMQRLFFFLCFFSATHAFARQLVVGKQGAFRTIKAAIAAARPGDTV